MENEAHFNLVYTQMDWSEPGKFLGIAGEDASDSQSIRLHADIFRFCFIHMGVFYRLF